MNSALSKVLIVLGLLLALFIALGFIWLNHLGIQTIVLVVTALLLCIRKSTQFLYHELRALIPFLLGWVAVYAIFALLNFKPGTIEVSATKYWLSYGTSRLMVLLNMLFAIQLTATLLKWNDIISLPGSIRIKKYLILGKSLYETAFSAHTALGLHVSLIPSHQHKNNWRNVFDQKLTYLLAILSIVLKESEIKGEAIDNRIKHCYRRTP